MKKVKNIIYTALASSILLGACDKGFEELNKPWNKPTAADYKSVYNGVVASLELTWNEQMIANSWIYPITQLGATSANSGYLMKAAETDIWNNYYRTLINIRLMDKLIAESTEGPERLKNVQLMTNILKAYKTFRITDLYGDIPYTDAGRANEGSQYYANKYDSQKDIYESLLNELKAAVSELSTDANQINMGSSEQLFNNDIVKWKKFANSLRLRYALRMYEVNPSVATTHITEALALPLLEAGEDVGLSPAKYNLSGEGREWSFYAGIFLKMGSTAWNLMSDSDAKDGSGIFDPRAKIYFETNAKNEWVAKKQNASVQEGGEPYHRRRDDDWSNKGQDNKLSNFNYYWGRDKQIIDPIITAAEVNFMKAEVAARGIGAGPNMAIAKAEYEKGVETSVKFWTQMAMNSEVWVVNKPNKLPTSEELKWITNNPKVAFPTGANTDKALLLIYAQQWLDNFRQPYEAWALMQRTKKTPKETEGNANYSRDYDMYQRFHYPDSEAQYNEANMQAARGNKSEPEWRATPVWWAK